MHREREKEGETRARSDVRTPSSGWNEQWVDLKLAAFTSAALGQRVRTQKSSVWRLVLAFVRVRRVQWRKMQLVLGLHTNLSS